MSIQQTDNSAGELTSTSDHALAYKSPFVETSAEQAHELLDCEATIKQVLVEGLFRAGAVLRKIRDEKLYESIYESFDGYIALRWGWSSNYVHRLIVGATMYEVLAILPIGKIVLPTAESQVRPLAHLKDPDKQRAAWQLAVDAAGGRVPTAEQVKVAVFEIGPPAPNARRAKFNVGNLLLDQTGAKDVSNGNGDPGLIHADDGARESTDNEDQETGKLASAPLRTTVCDENEPPISSDLPKATHSENGGLSSDGNEGVLNPLPLDVIPQNETIGTVCSENRSLQRRGSDGNEIDDRGGGDSMACKTAVGDVKLVRESRPSSLATGVSENGESVPAIRTTAKSVPVDVLSAARTLENAMQPSARFDFADGTNAVSTMFSGDGEVTTRLVQSGLAVVAHSTSGLSLSEIARRQRCIVMISAALNQATQEEAGLNAQQAVRDIEYAVFVLKKLLDKRNPKKGRLK